VQTSVPVVCKDGISVGDSFTTSGPFLILLKQANSGHIVIDLVFFENDIANLSIFGFEQIKVADDTGTSSVSGTTKMYYDRPESSYERYGGQMLFIQWVSDSPVKLTRGMTVTGFIHGEMLKDRYYIDGLHRNDNFRYKDLDIQVKANKSDRARVGNRQMGSKKAGSWSVMFSLGDPSKYGVSREDVVFAKAVEERLQAGFEPDPSARERYQNISYKLPRLRFKGGYVGFDQFWGSLSFPGKDCQKCNENNHKSLLESVECKGVRQQGIPAFSYMPGFVEAEMKLKGEYEGKDSFPVGLVLNKYTIQKQAFEITYLEGERDRVCEPAKGSVECNVR
jgi:hypothetical protein